MLRFDAKSIEWERWFFLNTVWSYECKEWNELKIWEGSGNELVILKQNKNSNQTKNISTSAQSTTDLSSTNVSTITRNSNNFIRTSNIWIISVVRKSL